VQEVFTEGARAALHVASEEARVRRQQLGTPHLLLGLLDDEAGRPAGTLRSMGLPVSDVRAEALRKIGPVLRRVPRRFRPPRSERVEAVLAAAAADARNEGYEAVDAEHLLVALLADPEGKAARLLHRLRARAS
jgi:ATP-dependent Clp protease ATP-binding subunit ClpC